MTDIAELAISINSGDVKKADTELSKFGKTADKTTSVVGRLGPAIAAMITVDSIRRAQQMGEQYNLLASRVGRLSANGEDAARTMRSLLVISNQTGASIGETTKLWESLNLTLKDLGGNAAQVIQFTTLLQKIGTVGGSSADEMSNALRQLGQSLSGGVVRAEEFNSILENMPMLAREIAAGLGIPFSELRQLMLDGGLTSEKVLSALQARASSVNAEFEKMPRTVSQASSALTNSLGAAFAALDKQIGASTNLAKFIDTVARGIRLTAGELTDQERLLELAQQRTKELETLNDHQTGIIKNSRLEEAARWRIAQINKEIGEIQDRRIQQQKDESAAIGATSQKATEARAAVVAAYAEELKQAQMAGEERARYLAVQKLGVGATEEEKKAAGDLAVEIYKLSDSYKQIETKAVSAYDKKASAAEKSAERERAAAERAMAGAMQAELDAENRRLSAGQAVRPVLAGLSGEDPELTRLAEQQARKLEILREGLDAEYLTKAEYDAQLILLDEQTAQRRKDIEAERASAVYMGYAQLFDGIGGLTAQFAGEQSGIARAMFAVSKAFAIADAIVKIQQGIASAAALPFPANIPAMASVAAATSGIVSTISSTTPSFDGGGYTGAGPRVGGVDGKGGFMAVMHPQERVIDEYRGQSAGSGVVVNINNAPAGSSATSRTGPDGQQIIDVIIADVNSGGPMSRKLQQSFGLQRRGT